MPRGMAPAAYPRVARCFGLRLRNGSELALASPLSEPGRLSPPIWPCTTRGFPCPRCCHRGGGLLPHLFTLTCRVGFGRRLAGFPVRCHRASLCRRSILCGTIRD